MSELRLFWLDEISDWTNHLKTIKSELLAVYCFTFERFLHDPEDLIEESSSLILETSSAFSTEPLPEDRDEIFWKSFDKMRIIAEDDIVALDGFSLAAQLCQKQIKIRYALRLGSSLAEKDACHWLAEVILHNCQFENPFQSYS